MAGLGGGSPLGDDGPRNEGLEPSHHEAAEYIASMLEALQQLAGSAKMTFLAYLINVALEEARIEKAKRD